MYRKTLILLVCFCFFVSLAAAVSRAPKPPQGPAKAIDFTLKDLNGKSHALSEYKGKLVFLNFWATWCPPCREEMPSMQKLYNDSDKNKFVMLAVDVGEGEAQVRKFAARNGYTFPILLDIKGDIGKLYKVRGIPATFIIDQAGNLVAKKVGARHWTWEEFLPLIK